MLACLVFFGGAPNFKARILGGFIGQFLVLAFVPSSYFFYLSEEKNYYTVILSTAVAAIVTAFLDRSVLVGVHERDNK